MRGFRPSHYQSRHDEFLEDRELTKADNVRRYMERANAGLPIFDDEQTAPIARQRVALSR